MQICSIIFLLEHHTSDLFKTSFTTVGKSVYRNVTFRLYTLHLIATI